MQIDPRKLVDARLARALSQEELAIASDLSSRTIQRIEAGHVASLESTKALLAVFGPDIIHDPMERPETQLRRTLRWTPSHLGRRTVTSASYGLDGLRLLFAAVFVLVAVAKPFMPGETGLFVDGNTYTIGWLMQAPAGSQEVLGYWITPLMMVMAATLLLTIGRVRRLILPSHPQHD
jgi:transcriptional regulator with XRE-family HTH domain